MRIFVMWSGNRSKQVGEAAAKLFGNLFSGAKVFISTRLAPGTEWENELTKNLREANIGIVCLTSENLENPWMHFESGMIAKMPDHRICPLRIGLRSVDIDGPLKRYQSIDASDRNSVFHLVQSLNDARPLRHRNRSSLQSQFEAQWVEFQKSVE